MTKNPINTGRQTVETALKRVVKQIEANGLNKTLEKESQFYMGLIAQYEEIDRKNAESAARLERSTSGGGKGKAEKGKKKTKNNEIGNVQFDDEGNVVLVYDDGTEEFKGKPEFFEYQEEFIDCEKRNQFWNKTRQGGFSWAYGWKMLKRAIQKGHNQILISASKNQAFSVADYVKVFAELYMDVKLSGTENIKLEKDGKIHAKLMFRGANAATSASYSGDLGLDEVLWIPNYEKVERQAKGIATHKQFIRVYFSAPSSVTHPAWKKFVGQDARKGDKVRKDDPTKKEDGLFRRTVTIVDAIKGGLNLVDIKQLEQENTKDEFKQLYMCQPIDDEDSVFPWEVIKKCMVDSSAWEEVGHDPVWAGYDPSRSRDNAAFAAVQPPYGSNKKYRVRDIRKWNGINFRTQADDIESEYLDVYNIQELGMDVTGPVGQGAEKRIKPRFPKVTPIFHTNERLVELITRMKDLIGNGLFEFDSSLIEIANAFMRIKQTVTQSRGVVTYKTDRTKSASGRADHGDIAWAIIYAISFHEVVEVASSVFAFSD